MTGALDRPEPARGVLRITRHPVMWGVGLWAAVHLVANGDLASLLFFGGFLLTALGGAWHLDRRLAATEGESPERVGHFPTAWVYDLRGRHAHQEARGWLPAVLRTG
jgi:uncharacterized membrane protein